MLTVEMTSTTANPSITLPRNRNVGSFIDANLKPTPDPQPLFQPKTDREAKLPSRVPRINAELIKGRKFEHIGDSHRTPAGLRERMLPIGGLGPDEDTATKFVVAKSRHGASNWKN
ncbi:MAG: hypothetical protein ACJ8EK_04485 [Bradyrhizobium sp.]